MSALCPYWLAMAGTSCHDFLWCATRTTRTRNACFVDVQDGCPGREPVSPGQAEVRVGKESDVRNEDARSVGRLEGYHFFWLCHAKRLMIPEKKTLLHRNPGLLHFLLFLYKIQFSDTVGGARRCQTARVLQIARAHPQAIDEQLGQMNSPECHRMSTSSAPRKI